MSIWKKIFSGDKTIEAFNNAFNRISSGIDNLVFTNQERAEIFKGLLKSYEPYKLAQRLIALIVIPAFIFGWLVALALLVASIWNPDLTELSKVVFEQTKQALGVPVSLIIGFYFAGGMTEGIIARIKQKKEDNGKG